MSDILTFQNGCIATSLATGFGWLTKTLRALVGSQSPPRNLGLRGPKRGHRVRIVNLNCSVQLRKHGQPVKVSKEREKVKQDMKNLKPINSKDDLIKAYPDRFKGIGKFPGTYHIYLKEHAIPVVHKP